MNKFGIVLGVAAIATLAGCKDPDYQKGGATSQNDVKNVDTAVAKPVEVTPVTKPVEVTPVTIEPVAKKCTCAPGTKHTSPCTCGAPDCKCVVEVKPVVTAVVSEPVEPEYTIYVVQSGDYLAKISKRFNVTISSIKRLNPSIKKDVIRVGQKLKIPGKVDVGVQSAPNKAVKSAKKASVASYAGATKEYVVKNGDTLGSIAYGNGINIRQLKQLNGLTSDTLKIGQKLKIPVEKTVKSAKSTAKKAAAPVAAKAKATKSAAKAAAPAEAPAPAAEAASAPEVEPAAEAAPAPATEAVAPATEAAAPAAAEAATAAPDAAKPAEAAPAATTTYVVQEGDDMTGVSIRWGVSAAQIRELNNLAEGDQLVPGQIIKLPAEAQQ